jgi:C1A family cysteine protease
MALKNLLLVSVVAAVVAQDDASAWPIDPDYQVPNTTAWVVDPGEPNLPAVNPETFSIDWRTKGAVSTVKSQCGGTCWSFSATGNMEGAWAVAGHGLVSLSEQFLQDGCSGGGPYGIPVKGGRTDGKAPSEAQYPTTKAGTAGCGKKTCVETGYSAQIDKVLCLQNKGPESDILNWLQRGPVSISIAAKGFSGYKKGILGRDGGDCSASQLDHAVLIVGYGIDNGQKYWIMKNSWGTGFGESGFWRMKYGVNCMKLADGGPCIARSSTSHHQSPVIV